MVRKLNTGSASFRRRRHDATAELLIAAADAAIARRGYDAVTMREIAAEAGCAPGTLYLYFRNKREVLSAIAERHRLRVMELVRAALTSTDDPLERLRRLMRALIDDLNEHASFVRVFYQRALPVTPARLMATMAPRSRRQWEALWDEELAVIREAQARGQMRSDIGAPAIQEFMRLLIVGVLSTLGERGQSSSSDEQMRVVWGFFTGGVGATERAHATP